jgi:hypothetical protein
LVGLKGCKRVSIDRYAQGQRHLYPVLHRYRRLRRSIHDGYGLRGTVRSSDHKREPEYRGERVIIDHHVVIHQRNFVLGFGCLVRIQGD